MADNKRILIVEDDADISMVEEAYLQSAGFETRIVTEGTAVSSILEREHFDLLLLEKTIKEEVARDEVSVIITKTPCVLLDKRKKPLYIAHADKCKKCGMCMKPGCPAMTKNPDGTIHIDDTMCTGCGLCKDLCKFDAIELIKEGE